MKYIVYSIAMILSIGVNAQSTYNQQEYTNWIVGSQVFHFDLENDKIDTSTYEFRRSDGTFYAGINEGGSVISDESGNLLFSTNGSNVHRPDGTVMKNGKKAVVSGFESTKIERSTSMNGTMIIKHPEDVNKYYIIGADDENGGIIGLTYNIVDMTADEGRGEVSNSVNIDTTRTSEAIAACMHANGTDI